MPRPLATARLASHLVIVDLWLAPVFGLLGTIVGRLITAYAAGRAERNRGRSEARAVAVLLRDELAVTDDRIAQALVSGIWGAVLDPGLPYASGLWAVEHREGRDWEVAASPMNA